MMILPQVSDMRDIPACFALNIEQLWTLLVLLAKKSILRFSDKKKSIKNINYSIILKKYRFT